MLPLFFRKPATCCLASDHHSFCPSKAGVTKYEPFQSVCPVWPPPQSLLPWSYSRQTAMCLLLVAHCSHLKRYSIVFPHRIPLFQIYLSTFLTPQLQQNGLSVNEGYDLQLIDNKYPCVIPTLLRRCVSAFSHHRLYKRSKEPLPT